MTTPRQIAEAFSGHRFADVYAALAPDVRWTAVGEGLLTGRQAVVDACKATLAVDAVGHYLDADGAVSVVSSCDIYEFHDGALQAITSYAVELDPTAGT
jgi:hypothetical protein